MEYLCLGCYILKKLQQFYIYDFDDTIYNGDSSVDFFFYMLKNGHVKFSNIIKMLYTFLLWKLKIVKKERFKESFFAIVKNVEDIDKTVLDFWKEHKKNIKNYYKEKKHDKDIIISASPEFLLKPICKELEVKKLMASPVNKKTGLYEGINCHNKEKVRRLNEVYQDYEVLETYSDSLSDKPILDLAKEGFIVKGDKLIPYEKKIYDKTIINRLISLVFIVSSIFMGCLLSNRSLWNENPTYLKVYFVINVLLIPIITYLLEKKYFSKKIIYQKNKILKIVSFIIAIYIAYKNMYMIGINFSTLSTIASKFNIILNHSLTMKIIAIASIPALFIFINYLLDKTINFIKNVLKDLNKIEKIYIILITIVAFVGSILVYSKTNAFHMPLVNGNRILYDVVYTTDSGAHNYEQVFFNLSSPENDIRQPLFALFSLPVSIPAMMAQDLLSIIPNVFDVVLNTLQVMLLAFSFTLLSKMLNFKKKYEEILFLSILTVSYPTMLFSLVTEQYIMAVFYLILTIYCYHKNNEKTNYAYLGAVSTLLTSGILFPLISNIKNIKNYIKNTLKALITFITLTILSGQLPVFLSIKTGLKNLMTFTGEVVTFKDKIIQFTHFISSQFIAPEVTTFIDKGYNFVYRLVEQNNLNILGVIILILTIISFIINKKENIAKISFAWELFSIVILVLVGWGSAENGMVLYTLYFSWSYIVLLYLLLDKLLKKHRIIFSTIIIVFIVLLLVINTPSIIDLIRFGITHYPN